MGQTANPSRTKENEARSFVKNLRSSPRKLNLVAEMIRGKNAGKAVIDLQFCRRRISDEVRKCLESAIANAENNHGLDVDRLVVTQATVGKSIRMKRFHTRGRGRGAKIIKDFSNLTIVVQEREA